MLKNILYSLSLSLTLLFAASACTDDLDIDNGYIGKGNADVSMTLSFHPLIAAETATGRAVAGDVLSDLNDIAVFVYDAQDNLYNIYSGDALVDLKVFEKNTEGSNSGTAPDVDATKKAEETTAKATFTLKGIPYGRYSFYAVANMGEFRNDEATRAKFPKSADLKKLTVKWDEGNIPANDQMFGFFTTPDDEESQGFDAPLLPINRTRVDLHAWVQRAASKITLVFDGAGLFDNIWIYVKKVTVKDIPRYCKIGEYNGVYTKAGEKDSLIVVGDCINYNQAGALPAGKEPSVDYKQWLEISRGGGKKGAVEVSENGDSTLHSEYAQALYFYENMQGNYENDPNKKFYDKTPDWDEVGTMPGPDDPGYKDNVPLGTYIEVEAYYNSTNSGQVSQGRIIYRFMLGQNDTYDYNAIRNHHYKITLGFKGYANQPDWHIAYVEPPRTIFTDPTYYVSYHYNQKAIFPIRIKGDIRQVEAEIVENNWAPFDSTGIKDGGYPVPKELVGDINDPMAFEWNRTVYVNEGKQDITKSKNYPVGVYGKNSELTNGNTVAANGYLYGLQRPYSANGNTRIGEGYPENEISKGAPEYVTPIWAGFLALRVPDGNLAAVTNTGLDYRNGFETIRNEYYNGEQNLRTLSSEDLEFSEGQTTKTVDHGNNACEITKAPDGSITVLFPMWTRPKSFFGISGFSGNNPYDTYQRRAIVKFTFTFSDGKKIVRYKPVYQVRRVVNPKAVWRRYSYTTPFRVVLSRRETADAKNFSKFDSEGAWRARVKTTNAGNFISLSGGQSGSGTEIYGSTGSPIEFDITFNSQAGAKESRCAIIEIEYHGFTCSHSIFVRQGFNTPLQIVSGGKKWSSFALYKCWGDNAEFGKKWDATSKNYIDAELTVSPLALGTMFKRGNYNGILISNNEKYGVGVAPNQGSFTMSSGGSMTWKEMQGYPVSEIYGELDPFDAGTDQRQFAWGHFKATVNGEERYYRVPTYEDYDNLRNKCEFGIGVMYGDGAEKTAMSVDAAYGFEDFENNGKDETNKTGVTRGMRGVIVFNAANANQIFFPVGARGVGRRTIQSYNADSYDMFGILRYSSAIKVLSEAGNSYRPIPYNVKASPGSLYWINTLHGNIPCWDCNYFDMNFGPYDYGAGFTPSYGTEEFNITHGGDAMPIKLILDE